MKTLKEILTELGVEESVSDSCPDMKLYSSEEIKELTDGYEARLKESEVSNAVNMALFKSGAKNNVAVKALLKLDNPTVENGVVSGLEEQIAKIKEENGYLFKTENSITAGNHNTFSKSDFSAMSDEQYYSIKYGKEN